MKNLPAPPQRKSRRLRRLAAFMAAHRTSPRGSSPRAPPVFEYPIAPPGFENLTIEEDFDRYRIMLGNLGHETVHDDADGGEDDNDPALRARWRQPSRSTLCQDPYVNCRQSSRHVPLTSISTAQPSTIESLTPGHMPSIGTKLTARKLNDSLLLGRSNPNYSATSHRTGSSRM